MDLYSVMRDVVRQAGKEILALLGSPDARRIVGKGAGGDATHGIDKVSETSIIRSLEYSITDCTVFSEESGSITLGKGGPPYFILDPLDGSTNALRGYPCFSISLAASTGLSLREVSTGVVLELPQGNIYWAKKGEGAFLNDVRIKPSTVEKLEEAFISVDLNLRRSIPSYITKVGPIIERAEHVRFLGTDALETCFVASGTCDAFIDLRGTLRLTDFAAATFIVREAGGFVVDGTGAPLDVKVVMGVRGAFIAACTGRLCSQLISVTRSYPAS